MVLCVQIATLSLPKRKPKIITLAIYKSFVVINFHSFSLYFYHLILINRWVFQIHGCFFCGRIGLQIRRKLTQVFTSRRPQHLQCRDALFNFLPTRSYSAPQLLQFATQTDEELICFFWYLLLLTFIPLS